MQRPVGNHSTVHGRPAIRHAPLPRSPVWRAAWLAVVLAVAGSLAAPVPAAGQPRPDAGQQLSLQPFVDVRTILFSSLAQEVGLLPSPTGGGFTYQFDAATGIFQRSSESLGSVFGERAETTGAGRFTFNAAYSRHTFDEVDGVKLRDGSLSSLVGFNALLDPRLALLPVCAFLNPLEIRQDVSADVGSVGALYGVTQDLDVGVTVPILKVSIKERVRVRRSSFDADPTCSPLFESTNEFRSSKVENTGIGDVNFRAKYNFGRWSMEGGGASLAASLDVRVPTGDRGDRAAFKATDANFQSDGSGTIAGSTFQLGDPPLGTGVVRVKPQLILSTEWGPFALNGAGGVELGKTEGITNDIVYQVGADYTPVRWVTISADLLGRTALNVDRRRIRKLDVCGLFEIDFSQFPNLSCVQPDGTRTPGADLLDDDPFANSKARATRLSASFGAKFNPVGALLLFVNFVIPVNDTGFRDDLVFTVGGEWSF